jgi:hypothetical protein
MKIADELNEGTYTHLGAKALYLIATMPANVATSQHLSFLKI